MNKIQFGFLMGLAAINTIILIVLVYFTVKMNLAMITHLALPYITP
jgi:hypothetical protein